MTKLDKNKTHAQIEDSFDFWEEDIDQTYSET